MRATPRSSSASPFPSSSACVHVDSRSVDDASAQNGTTVKSAVKVVQNFIEETEETLQELKTIQTATGVRGLTPVKARFEAQVKARKTILKELKGEQILSTAQFNNGIDLIAVIANAINFSLALGGSRLLLW